MVAQYTSTSYDQALRRFYLKILYTMLSALIVCGFVFLIIKNDQFRTSLVVSVVPFMPLLVWLIKSILSNRELVADQDETLKLMDDFWLQIRRGILTEPALLEAARDSQDALYIRRANGSLIFPEIYRLKRSKLEGRAARTASTFRQEFESDQIANQH